MKRFLRATFSVVAIAILCEVYFLWYQVEPGLAQTAPSAPFLGRPYYGVAVMHSARFDHQYPQYEAEATPDPSTRNTLVRDDGVIFANDCGDGWKNACYTGHDGRDFPFNGVYKPVVSAADGIVREARWFSPNHAVGLGLMMEVEHSRPGGVYYRTVYGHLSAVRYLPTTSVGRWQIGTAGITGNSSGVHLHFGLKFRKPDGVWVITDPYGWTGQYSDPWEARSGVASHFLWLPEPDRTLAEPPRGQIFQIDDKDPSSKRLCSLEYAWWQENTPAAIDGRLWRTYVYNYLEGHGYDCYATWGGAAHGSTTSLPSTGLYEVEVHIPAWNSLSATRSARYTVYFAGGLNTVVVDQSRVTSSTWISLGRYIFNQGTQLSQCVIVLDNSNIGGVGDSTSRNVLVDAIRLIKSH